MPISRPIPAHLGTPSALPVPPGATGNLMAAEEILKVELCMSTHLAIVVNLRMHFEDKAEYVGLVIPRSHCTGDRPTFQALLTAVHGFMARLSFSHPQKKRAPHAVWARIDGQWTSLLSQTGQQPHYA